MPEPRAILDEYDDPIRLERDCLLDVVRRLEIEKAELRQQLAELRRERRVAATGGER